MTSEESQRTTPSEANQPKPFYARWWFITIAVIVGLGMIGSVFGDPDETTSAADSTTTTESADQTTTPADTSSITTTEASETTTTAEAAPTTNEVPTTTSTIPPGSDPAFGSGTQVVGEDVQPGIYETGILGEGLFDGCYWERLSGFSGDFEEIIANNNVVVHDVVEIAGSDVGFDSDCPEWFELTPLDEPLATIPQGKWVLGVQINGGTYQAEGGDTCYWERLSGVSGEFGDITANDLPSGSAIVEISENDYAFNSSGCGEWTPRS